MRGGFEVSSSIIPGRAEGDEGETNHEMTSFKKKTFPRLNRIILGVRLKVETCQHQKVPIKTYGPRSIFNI